MICGFLLGRKLETIRPFRAIRVSVTFVPSLTLSSVAWLPGPEPLERSPTEPLSLRALGGPLEAGGVGVTLVRFPSCSTSMSTSMPTKKKAFFVSEVLPKMQIKEISRLCVGAKYLGKRLTKGAQHGCHFFSDVLQVLHVSLGRGSSTYKKNNNNNKFCQENFGHAPFLLLL